MDKTLILRLPIHNENGRAAITRKAFSSFPNVGDGWYKGTKNLAYTNIPYKEDDVWCTLKTIYTEIKLEDGFALKVAEENTGNWTITKRNQNGQTVVIESCRDGQHQSVAYKATGKFRDRELRKRFNTEVQTEDRLYMWFDITKNPDIQFTLRFDAVSRAYSTVSGYYESKEQAIAGLAAVGPEDKVKLQNARISIKLLTAFDEDAFYELFCEKYDVPARLICLMSCLSSGGHSRGFADFP